VSSRVVVTPTSTAEAAIALKAKIDAIAIFFILYFLLKT
jgi:hypothetical protein